MALAGVEHETLVSEPDALTTRFIFSNFARQATTYLFQIE